MIARLSGPLFSKSPAALIVDVQGVGYEVAVPLSTFDRLPEVGSQVALHIHTHLREDALQLYGFGTQAEKHLFLLLIGVAGIGPKLALGVLSGIAARDLIAAIRGGKVERLRAIPGIGPKTAGRLVLELKDKLAAQSDFSGLADLGDLGDPADTTAPADAVPTADQTREDLLSALVNLGYPRAVASRAIEQIGAATPGDATLSDQIKAALKILGRVY